MFDRGQEEVDGLGQRLRIARLEEGAEFDDLRAPFDRFERLALAG